MSSALEPQLLRQLRRAGISEDDAEAAPEAWRKLLRSVSEHYRHVESDRALLARSSEVAANMVTETQQRMNAEQDAVRTTLTKLADVVGLLGALGRIAGEDDGQGATPQGAASETAIETAKDAASREIESLLGEVIMTEGTNTELSTVKANVRALADQLGGLLTSRAESRAELAKIDRELESARALQAALLPTEEPITRSFVEIAGVSRSLAACGGDFWSTYTLADDRELVLVGDVTGHGLTAAIVAGAAKAASALACAMSERTLGAGATLARMNTAIHETAKRQSMMTCAAATFDAQTRSITVANAGHPFPYLVRNGLARPLVVHGPPLGAAETATYDETTVPLEPGDAVVWYTDGVIEAENEWGEQFSEKRLRAISQRLAKDGVLALRDGILDLLTTFRAHKAQADDLTVVVAVVK